MSKKTSNGWSNNATIAAIIGAVVTFILGAFSGGSYIEHKSQKDRVSFESISTEIKNVLVNPKLIDAEILDFETPFEQLDYIASAMRMNEQSKQELVSSLYDLLKDNNVIESGAEADYQQLLSMLSNYISNVSTTTTELENEIGRLSSDNESSASDHQKAINELNAKIEELQSEVTDYKEKTWAELSAPNATVLGEKIDTTLRDYMAVIQSHNYYSEDFLNQVLPKSFVFEDNTIFYDKPAPERVKVTSRIIYDTAHITTFDGGDHFSMGLNDYHYGVTSNDTSNNRRFKIACNREYSKITFTLGHIDNTDMSDGRLVIYYYDNHNELKECKSIDLHGNMPILSYEVPIYNTTTVIFEIVSRWGRYGIADIYLVK